MDVYGLTGGIGSGKSAVADLLESYGIPVVSADELSRIVVAHGSEGLRDVVRSFGPEILDDAGELDRRKLASIVFENPARRKELEAILHPRIRERFEQVLDALEKAGHEVAVYEVPLLFEKNLQTEMKAVILVTADEDIRIRRVQARDDVTEAEVRARMAAQMDEDSKRRRADYVIENNGTEDDLRREVEFMLERFMRIGGQRAKSAPRQAAQTVLTAPRRNGVTSIYAPLPSRGTAPELEEDASPSLGVRLDPPAQPPRATRPPSRVPPTAPPRDVRAAEAPSPAFDPEPAVPIEIDDEDSGPWAERLDDDLPDTGPVAQPRTGRTGRPAAAPERRTTLQAAKTAPHRSTALPNVTGIAETTERDPARPAFRRGTQPPVPPSAGAEPPPAPVPGATPHGLGSPSPPGLAASPTGAQGVTSHLGVPPAAPSPASGSPAPSLAPSVSSPSSSPAAATVPSLSVPPAAPPLLPPPPLRTGASPTARKEPEDPLASSRNEPPPPPVPPRRTVSPQRRGDADDDSSSET